MKTKIINMILLALISVIFAGCGNAPAEKHDHAEEETEAEHAEHKAGGLREVHLTDLQFNSLSMKVDSLPVRALSGIVEANGQLEVPPQHEASITAILGANVTAIKVIEGDKVKKGQVLAYLAHPTLAKLQSDYLRAFSTMQYLEKDYNRQKRLYEEKVGSGQTFQQIQSDYNSMKGEVKAYEAQLKQLNIPVEKLQDGELIENVPVVSPIEGYVEKVLVNLGQYVDPQKELFTVVNNDHIHADLMVFEKDVYKVQEGQRIYFTVQTAPGKTLSAMIFAVGKQFEQNPKAVHIHAVIEQKEGYLIPGMYINGKIHTESSLVPALPDHAIVEEDGKTYIFTAEQHQEDGQTEWTFEPVEIKTGMQDDGWTEIKLLSPLADGALLAMNNAYYLISEMKKGETEHHH